MRRRVLLLLVLLLSALREVDGKEELHLMILYDKVPVGSQLC